MKNYFIKFLYDRSGMVPLFIPIIVLLAATIGYTLYIVYSFGGFTGVIATLFVLIVSAFAVILTRYFLRNAPKK